MSFLGFRKHWRTLPDSSPRAEPRNHAEVKSPVDESGPPPLPARPPIGWRVLFVGGDSLWFQQIEHDLRSLQPAWQCQLAENSLAAGRLLAETEFDALIIDTGNAERDELAKRLQKNTGTRIGLARCNLSERATVALCQAAGIAPVAEEGDAAILVAGLKRAERLQQWMSNPAIKKLLPQLRTLPAAPELYVRVSDELRSAHGSMASVAQLISQDPIMSAKILQVVNSAFFGLARELTDMSEAVMIMGAERIRSLILLAGVFSQYDASKCPGFSVTDVWNHSVQVGVFARAIAFTETKDPAIGEAAFTAGLLHDIGKLILAGNLPQMYATVRRLQLSKKIGASEAELMALGITLAELGACLLGTWRLPLPILEAIAWHEWPNHSDDTRFSLLTAVHVANALTHERQKDPEASGIDGNYLKALGIDDDGNRWRSLFGLQPKDAVQTLAERVRRRREVKEN